MSTSTEIAEAPVEEMAPYDPATVVRHLRQELRHPLSTIESIAHYLNMVLPRTEAKARRQLVKLQEEVSQIQWVLADAAHFLQSTPPNTHLLDLTEVVARNLSEWNPVDGAGLSFALQPDLPLVHLDLEQMQHLLRNIVAFFRRISAPGRSVHLETVGADERVVLKITSTSVEYSPEDIEPLFEPFGSRFPAGTGLALASARTIAEAHGATIEVTSEPSHSLTLLISFPKA
ncbi:MAG: HAMP domain-containing sensor histidine kinase [Bryobacteraceae bacterium]|jgi:signal transduction histidine kinase